jgi:hypothetical protein
LSRSNIQLARFCLKGPGPNSTFLRLSLSTGFWGAELLRKFDLAPSPNVLAGNIQSHNPPYPIRRAP